MSRDSSLDMLTPPFLYHSNHFSIIQIISLSFQSSPTRATTHTDLILRCVRQNIPYRLIHNASIMNAVACCGLQLYSFGETVSIPFWDENWKPSSFVDKIISNKSRGLHTLCLLGKIFQKNFCSNFHSIISFNFCSIILFPRFIASY